MERVVCETGDCGPTSEKDAKETKQQGKEVKSKLNLEKICCHSILNLLSSRLLFNKITIKIHKTVNLYFIWV